MSESKHISKDRTILIAAVPYLAHAGEVVDLLVDVKGCHVLVGHCEVGEVQETTARIISKTRQVELNKERMATDQSRSSGSSQSV